MAGVLFGIVDRIHHSTSPGPGARLKPLREASPDKSHWQPTGDEFPNSGLVSWWQPPPDLLLHSPWYFQVEEAPTYDPNKPQHDYFRVRGTPSVPLELVDILETNDEEELREYLVKIGIPESLCSSKRIVIRQRSGWLIGPIDVVLRDRRYYADEKQLELPIALSQARSDLSLAEWADHRFLPPEGWSTKVGELDFSPNEVFLKRVLRDLRKLSPSIVDDVKLTDKLISRYCAAVGTASLSPAQRYRFIRLKNLTKHACEDLNLPAEALSEFLSIGTIAEMLQEVKKKAADETIAATEGSLGKVREQRAHLEKEAARLATDVSERQSELVSLEQQHASALKQFETRAKQRFRDLAGSASDFLAEIALIRAALNLPNSELRGQHVVNEAVSPAQSSCETLGRAEFLERINHCFASKSLSCLTSASLLASLVSGFVPIVLGLLGRESLSALGRTLGAGRLYWLPLNPTFTSPSQIRSEPLIQDGDTVGGASTLDDVLQRAIASSEISVLVLENINLAQIDSVLLPLIRQYVELRCGAGASSYPPSRVSTPIGIWPANLLLAGLAIESPFSLPVSTELWSYATFVDASTARPSREDNSESQHLVAPKASQILYETWTAWLDEINGKSGMDSMMLAAYVGHQIGVSSLLKRLLTKLASAIDTILAAEESADRVKLFAELTVIPYCLSRHRDVRSVLEGCPTPVALDEQRVDFIDSVFKSWGIDVP
jgi:hypothetical protein